MEINKESAGVYYSSSQSSELRDMQQVHRQKEIAKVAKGISTLGFSGELSTAIMLQRSDPEFIKTISCISDSYYIFLGTTIQLDDVVKMCCDSDLRMSCVLTQHFICAQVGLLTAAIIMTALQQMRVSTRYFQDRQLYSLKKTCFCLSASLLRC